MNIKTIAIIFFFLLPVLSNAEEANISQIDELVPKVLEDDGGSEASAFGVFLSLGIIL